MFLLSFGSPQHVSKLYSLHLLDIQSVRSTSHVSRNEACLVLIGFAATLLGDLHLLFKFLGHFVDLSSSLLIHLLKLSKIASVGMKPLVMQMYDVSGDHVEEVPVVTDHYKSLLPPLQVFLHESRFIELCSSLQHCSGPAYILLADIFYFLKDSFTSILREVGPAVSLDLTTNLLIWRYTH